MQRTGVSREETNPAHRHPRRRTVRENLICGAASCAERLTEEASAHLCQVGRGATTVHVRRRRSNGGYRLSLPRLFLHVLTWLFCERGAPRPDMRWVTRERLSPREVVMSLLAIYLRDHHAAAVAGTRLARRVANVAPRDASGELSKVAKEIAEDLATLERFMDGSVHDPIA